MTTNADIIAKLQDDVAAASADLALSPRDRGLDSHIGYERERRVREEARARIAALDGPALLERLVALYEQCGGPDLELEHGEGIFEEEGWISPAVPFAMLGEARAAIAQAAVALEVP